MHSFVKIATFANVLGRPVATQSMQCVTKLLLERPMIKAILKDWNLADLRTTGMKCEIAAADEEKNSGKR